MMTGSNIANMMLESFQKELHDEIQWFDPAWSEIGYDHNGTIDTAFGRNGRVSFVQKTGRNQGVGYRSEASTRGTLGTDNLPIPGSITSVQMYASFASLYGGINVTGQGLALMKQPGVSVVDMLKLQLVDLRTTLERDSMSAFWGAGDGAIARLTTGSTLQNGTNTVICRADHEFSGINHLEVGMVIEASSARTSGTQDANQFGTASTTATITSIDYDTNSFTYTDAAGAASTLTDGDFLFRSGNEGQVVPMGLTGIIDGPYTGTSFRILTTLQNISGATSAYWRAQVDDNSGTDRSFSEVLLQKQFDKIQHRGGIPLAKEGGNFRIISTPGVQRALLSLWGDRRYNTEYMTLKGGFSALKYQAGTNATIPWITSPYCPSNCIFIVYLPALKIAELEGWHWMSTGEARANGLAHRQGHDEYENHMVRYFNLVVPEKRQCFGVIRDLTEL